MLATLERPRRFAIAPSIALEAGLDRIRSFLSVETFIES
jgi:hypothetical protein